SAADDGVVLLQPHRHRLAAIDFLLHAIPDQSFQFLTGWRPLPCAGEALGNCRDLPFRNDNLSWLLAAASGYQTVSGKNRDPQQEEMQQRLSENFLHQLSAHGYFAGVYQIGGVEARSVMVIATSLVICTAKYLASDAVQRGVGISMTRP